VQVRILFVENHTVFARTVIEQFLGNHQVVLVPTVAAAKQALGMTFDAVLVDYDLPDGKGTEVVRALRAIGFEGNIVAVSSREDGNAELRAAGVTLAPFPQTREHHAQLDEQQGAGQAGKRDERGGRSAHAPSGAADDGLPAAFYVDPHPGSTRRNLRLFPSGRRQRASPLRQQRIQLGARLGEGRECHQAIFAVGATKGRHQAALRLVVQLVFATVILHRCTSR
jgi:CheY-like chemotaxis protein